jgi:ABC-type Fe3+ transport system permease subunit
MPGWIELLGLAGFVMVIGSYLLLNKGKLTLRGFNMAILVSAVFLLPYGYLINSPTVILINFFWAIVSIYGISRKKKLKQ